MVLADAPRLLGYGFTRLLPAGEAERLAAGMMGKRNSSSRTSNSPAQQRPSRRYFAPHCAFNDLRSPQVGEQCMCG